MSKTNQFNLNLQKQKDELYQLYEDVYSGNPYYNYSEKFKDLTKLMEDYYNSRKPKYKKADIDNPHWFNSNKIVGTTLYVDLFSDNLSNFKKYIPYFKDLGINFIHFMPILEGRPGENDGGYAVKDYKNIDSKFGTTEDFQKVLDALKRNHIHSCIDFVVNHTAKEHEFAQKALAGDQDYMDMYLMYDNDDIPKVFEQTVPEVFPKVSPGNFTYYEEIGKWVFTSFYHFQWDLNYQNPLVFEKIIDILLHLANIGVDMIRLDAIPFMWKEIGHTCRNHPTIHKLLRMINIIANVVCPSVALLGEAIVEPEEIVKYFGQDQSECHIMYNATHMVNIWNSIATRDTRLLQIDSKRLHPMSGGSWINYARCHDDIGWGFNQDALRHMGFDPFAHKQFLINFYRGSQAGSFSIGDLYEFNPEDMDARNCGSMASLLGLEKAINQKDLYQKELAVKRINLVHSLLMAASGIPLIYSGDEIATLNNYDYLNDPNKSHDSRWLHRSHFDHERAKNRKNLATVEGQVFNHLRHLIAIRKEDDIFAPSDEALVIDTYNNHVYALIKRHKMHTLIALFNFSEDRQFIHNACFHSMGIYQQFKDLITGKYVDLSQNDTLLGPYESLWLKI